MSSLSAVVVFVLTCFVGGAACAPQERFAPVLRLVIGMVVALGLLFAGAFLGFALGLPNQTAALAIGALGTAGVVARWKSVEGLLRDRTVLRLIGLWAVFAAWTIGLLALIESYSGGGWAVDWVEHWQRTLFFVERQPLTTRFALVYSFTARPPLANLLVATWLEATSKTFADYQLLMALLSGLVFLPVAVITQRFSTSRNAATWALLVLMVNPFVLQNVTFSWTKLPTAFFVLAGLAVVFDALDSKKSVADTALVAACFGLAMLTHYSAGPWVIAVFIAYTVARPIGARANWRELVLLVSAFLAVLLPWIGWTVTHYGWRETFGSNTTAEAWHAESIGQRIVVPLLNLRDTLIPFLLRGEPHDGLITQSSQLGRIRDIAFNLYQINLPLAFGLGGLMILAFACRRKAQGAPSSRAPLRAFLWIAVPTAIVLGTAVHTARDEWGLAHICLHPLVLFGLGWIAAKLSETTGARVLLWGFVSLIDFGLGVILQFAIESGKLAAWGGARVDASVADLSRVATANAADKAYFHLQFLADRWHLPTTAITLWLASCLAVTLLEIRLRRSAST